MADLIYHARTKLDKLGRVFRLLPIDRFHIPSVNALPENSVSIKAEEKPQFANPALQEALQSEEAFDKLYVDILIKDEDKAIIFIYEYVDMTSRALSLYTSSGRFRSVVRLNFDLANLYFHRFQWDKAEPLLKTVSSTYLCPYI